MAGSSPLHDLLSAEAVRNQCARIGAAALENRCKWFRFDSKKLQPCIDLVAKECIQNYPDLAIPYHSRWRHFVVDGKDLWKHYAEQKLDGLDQAARTRCAIDLVFISVLLDAGAGSQWQYTDPVTQLTLQRSEGLAAASIDLFFNHLGRAESGQGIIVDTKAIRNADKAVFEHAFQHRSDNQLLGIDGRMKLLIGLADQLEKLSMMNIVRPGNLYDYILMQSDQGKISAGGLLQLVLTLFNPMWPSGLVRDGVHLGDCGYHSLLQHDSSSGLVPFHKLSQWLTYSLIEPLEWAGIEVTDLDQLTGLPEYRNGGLLLDCGVIVPLDPALLNTKLTIESEAVVEWRALTVWLLDQIAHGVREKLGKSKQQLPLASVLQGGTWSAGRKLAHTLRDGVPPLNLDIDGTVF